MNILDQIIAYKHKEVEQSKELYPMCLLEKSVYFESQPVSLKKYLTREDKSGIIAEIKKQSPSIGIINKYADIEKVSIGYMQAGASALSVLTDSKYFGGSNKDLTIVRQFNFCPILRKDFIVDSYQITEAKSIGADAILLIAAVLTKQQIAEFTQVAHSLGLEVLLEVHAPIELDKVINEIDIIGVNNRDLSSMTVNIEHSVKMSTLLPPDKIRVSESGIDSPQKIQYLRGAGYNGFLMGTYFMKHAQPHIACKDFINELNTTSTQQLKLQK